MMLFVLGITTAGWAFRGFLGAYEGYLSVYTPGLSSQSRIPYLGTTPLGLVELAAWPVVPFLVFYLAGGRISLDRDLSPFVVAAIMGGILGVKVGDLVGTLAFYPFSDFANSFVWNLSNELVYFLFEGFEGFTVAFAGVALKQYLRGTARRESTGT